MNETYDDFLNEEKCTCTKPEYNDTYFDYTSKEQKTHCDVCGGIPPSE